MAGAVAVSLPVAKNLSIIGPGAASLAVSGHTDSRVFEVSSKASVSISGLSIRDGHAPDGAVVGAAGANGGGIYNLGSLTLDSCAVISNIAGSGFGLKAQPLSTGASVAGGAGGHGGGIYSLGSLKMTSCTVSGNAGGRGGRSWNSLFGNNTGGAGGHGGGLFNAGTSTLTGCTLSGNTGGAGGIGGGHLSFSGPGSSLPGGAGGSGGGAYNAGALTFIACTLGGNSAGAGGTGASGGQTGGIGGAGGGGGGLYNATHSLAATLRSSLAALNQAGPGGAGGTGATATGNPGAPGTGPDLSGAFTSQGHNLVGQADGSSGLANGLNNDLAGSSASPLNPGLGPLRNNGGSTSTMALLGGSPALDAGDDALTGPPFNLSTDQRGLPRRSGTHLDIGAFEAQVAGAFVAQVSSQGLTSSPIQPFRLTVVAPPGTSGTIAASTNLSSWALLTLFTTSAEGTYEFVDNAASTLPQRFYRVAYP